MNTKILKPFVGLLGTVAFSGGVVAFVGSHYSAQQHLGERRRRSHQAQFENRFSALSAFLSQNNVTLCEVVEGATPSSEIEGYRRMELPERGTRSDDGGHAIFNLLLGEHMIERYDIYRRPDDSANENVIIAHVELGSRIDGHPGVVHGGILSLIFDDALGFGFEALGVNMAVTANLNVNFRTPVMAGTNVRVVAQLEHREGRKLYWKAQMTSMDKETLFAEATSLYIIPRSASS